MLKGVCLHGSLAMGSYYPPKSDMDVIAVVRKGLDTARAAALLYKVAVFAGEKPTIGDIEFSVITEAVAKSVPNPMPYELRYSEAWRARILSGEVAFGAAQFDSDLFAHLLCLKQRGVCLCGAAIDDVFGEVAWADFMYAVLDGENILESPYYCVFNICRVLQLLEIGERRVYSKEEGALWGLSFFPAAFAPMIQKALDVYRDDTPIAAADRRRGGVAWDDEALLVFRDYAREMAAKHN